MLSPVSETVALHKRLIRNPVVNYCFEGGVVFMIPSMNASRRSLVKRLAEKLTYTL